MPRQAIFPSLIVSKPDDYPEPTAGRVTRWTLATPDKEPVGVLVFNEGGVFWTFARTEDDSAQAHGAELLQYLRGNRMEQTPLGDVLAGVRHAYAGDLIEDFAWVRFNGSLDVEVVDLQPTEVEYLAPWPEVLDEETEKESFRDLLQFVADERAKGDVYPAPQQVFAAFHLTEFKNVRVVILGQDPYHQPGQANGLCFSVPTDVPKPGVRKPPSLTNIHAAMHNEGIEPKEHGDLTAWAKQGVLLLNTALTVRRGMANSHAKEWREFTDAVIRRLSAGDEPLVFVLWGRKAQSKKDLIDTRRHEVIEAPHPAARGMAQVQFRESKTFTKVNQALHNLGHHSEIDWAIR